MSQVNECHDIDRLNPAGKINENLVGGPSHVSKMSFKGPSSQIPDPNERTPNDPTYLMSSENVFKLVNWFIGVNNGKYADTGLGTPINPISSKQEIIKENLEPIFRKGKEMGWKEVKLMGKQLLFISVLDS